MDVITDQRRLNYTEVQPLMFYHQSPPVNNIWCCSKHDFFGGNLTELQRRSDAWQALRVHFDCLFLWCMIPLLPSDQHQLKVALGNKTGVSGDKIICLRNLSWHSFDLLLCGIYLKIYKYSEWIVISVFFRSVRRCPSARAKKFFFSSAILCWTMECYATVCNAKEYNMLWRATLCNLDCSQCDCSSTPSPLQSHPSSFGHWACSGNSNTRLNAIQCAFRSSEWYTEIQIQDCSSSITIDQGWMWSVAMQRHQGGFRLQLTAPP